MACNWSHEDWYKYIFGNMIPQQRNSMDIHLASCATCLSVYEEIMLSSMPSLQRLHGEAPDLIQVILQRLNPPESGEKRRLLLLHYISAASIAIGLLYFGFFEVVFNYANFTEQAAEQSDQVIHQMFSDAGEQIGKFAKNLNK